MPRFNLICHGMMLFLEDDDQFIRICLPSIPGHAYAQGLPAQNDPQPDPVLPKGLHTLPAGNFVLSGLTPVNRPLREMISPVDNLVLRKTKLQAIPEYSRTTIRVPKPHVIRPFRTVEVDDDVFGGTDPGVAMERPSMLHDVLALGYCNVPETTVISIGDWFTSTVGKNDIHLCIYSQTPTELAVPHPTGLNDIMVEKSTGRHPLLQLSMVGKLDGPPDKVAITPIDISYLLSLFELSGEATDETGCTPAVLVED
jgi:hypothetical protein